MTHGFELMTLISSPNHGTDIAWNCGHSYSISVLWQWTLVSMLKFEFAVKSKFVLCIIKGGECGLVK